MTRWSPWLLCPLLAMSCVEVHDGDHDHDDGHDDYGDLTVGANIREHALTEAGRWIPSAALTEVSDQHELDYDSAPPWDDGVNCSGGATDGARTLKDVVVAGFAQAASVGIYNCRVIGGTNSMSLHSVGRALDIMIPTIAGDADNGSGDPIATWLLENAAVLGVQAVIWDQTIWSVTRDPRARAYTGENPHVDHLHVEINEAAAFETLPWYDAPVGPGPVEPCPVLPIDGGIVDDGPCKQLFGNPQYWRVENAGIGGRLHWTNAFVGASPGNHARLSIALPSPDRYRVEVNLDPAYARFARTRYRVQHAGGEAVVVIDQGAVALASGGFVSLGEFDLDTDNAVLVEDNVDSFDGDEARSIMVDAVRVTRISLTEPVEPVEPVEPEEPVDPLEPVDPGDDDGPVLDGDDPGAIGEPLYVNVSEKGCAASGNAWPLALLGLVLLRRRRER